jgi:hypothetical protein
MEINKHPKIEVVFKDREEVLLAIKDLNIVLENTKDETPSTFEFNDEGYFDKITITGKCDKNALPSGRILNRKEYGK